MRLSLSPQPRARAPGNPMPPVHRAPSPSVAPVVPHCPKMICAHLRAVSNQAPSHRSLPAIFALALPIASALVGCEMQPAETLDYPRVLALRLEPAEPIPGEAHTATALTFETGPLTWSLCEEAWTPTLTCPTGAISLGEGNPVTFTFPDLESAWLKAEAEGASPAVKLVEVASGATNPDTAVLVGKDGPLPPGVEPEAELALRVDLGELSDEKKAELVVSWYVTAGTLEPARTLGTEEAILTTPASGSVRVVAVIREQAGGTTWAEATLTVGANP